MKKKFVDQLLRNARFKMPMLMAFDADDGMSGGSDGLQGESSAGGSDDGNGDGEDGEDSVEFLRAKLSKAEADRDRYKRSIDKLTDEKSKLTKEKRELMSADQLAKEAQEERDKQFAEMKKELRTNKYSKRLVGIGMEEKDADAFAATMPELEDADSFFNTLGQFIETQKKTAKDTAIQELLKNRPDIHAGNEGDDQDDSAMKLAKAAVARNAGRGVNQDILKNYIR